MQLRDFSQKTNSKVLIENVAKQFGYKLNIDNLTTKQLRLVEADLKKKIASVEVEQSYDKIFENRDYQKNRAFLEIITQALTERKHLSKKQMTKKKKYAEKLKTGKVGQEFKKRYGKDWESVAHATATKMAKSKTLQESVEILQNALSSRILREGEEEKAAIIMSSRDMVDKLTGWLEDVASLRAESFLELVDSIRDEMGSQVSISFAEKVKPSLEEVYNVLEKNRQTLAQAVAILTGEEAPTMGAEGAPEPGPSEIDMSAPAGGELPEEPMPGELPAAGAAGGTEAEGRTRRESIEYGRKLGMLLNSKKKE